jgi:hypothetical protein
MTRMSQVGYSTLRTCSPVWSDIASGSSSTSIMLHFASQVVVQKQQMYLGAKRTPPGRSLRALQLPRACNGCGSFTTCTGHGGNSSKRLLKDRPPHKLISTYLTYLRIHTPRVATHHSLTHRYSWSSSQHAGSSDSDSSSGGRVVGGSKAAAARAAVAASLGTFSEEFLSWATATGNKIMSLRLTRYGAGIGPFPRGLCCTVV